VLDGTIGCPHLRALYRRFNSLPRIALVPLITMIFGFGLVAKIVLAWTIVFFIVSSTPSRGRAAWTPT